MDLSNIKVLFRSPILLVVSLLLIFSGTAQAGDWVRIADLNGKWRFTIGDDPNWASEDFDDSSWEKIYAPETWEH